MNKKFLVPVAILAAGFAGFAQEANAKNGRQGAALGGAAAGIVAGAAGAYLLSKSMNQGGQPAPSYETTGTVRPAGYEEACRMRDVELFDRSGTYVKTEKLRVCR